MGLKILRENIDRIRLTKSRAPHCALIHMVMNFRIPVQAGNFLSRFIIMTLLYVVSHLLAALVTELISQRNLKSAYYIVLIRGKKFTQSQYSIYKHTSPVTHT